MNFKDNFPLCFYLNLGRRDDRRAQTERALYEVGIAAERFPAIDHRWLKTARGYEAKHWYACTLTHRLAIREAKLRKAPAVVIFEDDVVFDSDFLEKLEEIELPADWDLLFFGCTHLERPKPVTPGLVEATENLDNHCYAVRASAYERVISALAPPPVNSGLVAQTNDRALSGLLGKLKGYACYPNLAWQAVSLSDNQNYVYSAYFEDGTAARFPEIVHGLAAENLGLNYWELEDDEKTNPDDRPPIRGCPSPKIGLIFPVASSPELASAWLTYTEGQDDLVSVLGDSSASNSDEANHDIAGIRTTLNLLKRALTDKSLTHFVVIPHSCVPTKSLQSLIDFLQVDERSWISHQKLEESEVAQTNQKLPTHLPAQYSRAQNPLMILNREVTQLLATNNATHLFEETSNPAEYYFITTLLLMGYPLEGIINEFVPVFCNSELPNSLDTVKTTPYTAWSQTIRAPGFFAYVDNDPEKSSTQNY